MLEYMLDTFNSDIWTDLVFFNGNNYSWISERPHFYTVPDMKTLFDTASVDRILSFVKEVNLFSKIPSTKLLMVLSW